jgi:hypothetical protein
MLIDGIAGVRLILVLALCFLFVDLLSRGFVKHRWRFPRTLLTGLPASVMIVAVFLFSLALVKGADTVASMPRWVWEGIVVYSGVAIGLTIRLSDIPVHNESPVQPPPSRKRRA